MKNNFRFLLTLAMIFSMFVATLSFSTSVDASEVMLDSEGNVISNVEIEALADQLEFVHDEATIYDENGTFLGFDMDKIEAEYGSDLGDITPVADENEFFPTPVPEGTFNPDPSTLGVITDSAVVDRCINNKIKANFKQTFSFSTYQTIVTYLWQRQFTKAAGLLLKVGVKGNLFTLGITLSYYFFSCLPLRAK